MSKHKFTKEYLQEMLYEKPVEEVITSTSRWSIHYRRVFKYNDTFYETFYSRGATENQDEHPYEYADVEIECDEVVPIQVTRTEYTKVVK